MTHRKINPDELPSNNRDVVEPVVKGRVKTTRRVQSGLASDIRSITHTLFDTVLRPTFQTMILEYVTNALEMIFNGVPQGGSVSNSRTKYTTRNNRTVIQRKHQSLERSLEIDDIWFETRRDAEATLARMYELQAKHGYVSVGDFRNLANLPTNPTHENYGWVRVEGRIKFSARGGHYIDMPQPEYLSF